MKHPSRRRSQNENTTLDAASLSSTSMTLRSFRRFCGGAAAALMIGLVAGALPGCTAEAEGFDGPNYNPRSGLTLNEDTILSPRALSDVAVVSEDSVTVPKTSASTAWTSKLKKGQILAANRDTKHSLDVSTNPFGFVRRVERVTTQGDTIVISTSPAELKDAFSGSIKFDAPSVFKDAPAPRTDAEQADDLGIEAVHPLEGRLRPLDGINMTKDEAPVDKTNDKPKGTFEVTGGASAGVGLENPQFTLSATGTGEGPKFDVQTRTVCVDLNLFKVCQDVPVDGDVQAAKFDIKTTYDFSTTLTFTAKGFLEASYTGPALRVSFPAGPVPLVFSFTPSMTCHVNGEGEVKANARVWGNVSMGATVSTSPSVRSGADFNHEFLITEASGKVEAGCSVKGVASLTVIGLAGPQGSLSLGVTGYAETCDANGGKGLSRYAKLNIDGALGVSLVGKDFDLVSGTLWERSFPEESKRTCCSLTDLTCNHPTNDPGGSCKSDCAYPKGFIGPIPVDACRNTC